eukprot:TRINITY_DN66477_c8_g4_i1.p1 TRINITY_DN66477_c8_g4~~TRINITY_DN66477_c8_g4_i1.p1  ORF type:complete len:792 (-),score=481.46 TRINITY_DN66477_c8_g4_i1:158-2509(-)
MATEMPSLFKPSLHGVYFSAQASHAPYLPGQRRPPQPGRSGGQYYNSHPRNQYRQQQQHRGQQRHHHHHHHHGNHHGHGNRHGNRHGRRYNNNNQPSLIRGPVKALEKSDKGYKVTRNKDDIAHEERVKREMQAVLNKLTPEKFEKLAAQVVDMKITSVEVLMIVVEAVFEKALAEPNFSPTYAKFSEQLGKDLPSFPVLDEQGNELQGAMSFRRILLNMCQKEFEGMDIQGEIDGLTGEEREAARRKAKQRVLGMIRFIGELYLLNMLAANIIGYCLVMLLGDPKAEPVPEDLEALCKLLTTIGSKMEEESKENATARANLNNSFMRVVQLSQNKKLPSRIRFMLQDLVDLRRRKWRKRRAEVKQEKVSELRKKAAKQLASRNNNRGGGGGGGNRSSSRSGRRNDNNNNNGGRSGGGGRGSNSNAAPRPRPRDRYSAFSKNRKSQSPARTSSPASNMRGGSTGNSGSNKTGGRGWNRSPAGSSSSLAATSSSSSSSSLKRSGNRQGRPSSGNRRGGSGNSNSNNDNNNNGNGSKNARGHNNDNDDEDDEELDGGVANAFSALGDDDDDGTGRESIEDYDEDTDEDEEDDQHADGKDDDDNDDDDDAARKLENTVRTKSKALIKEYLGSHDKKEAVLCVQELPTQKLNNCLVYEIVMLYVDTYKPRDQELLVGLLLHFYAEKLVSSAQVQAGFDEANEFVDDMAIDLPKIGELLGQLYAKAVEAGAVTLSWLLASDTLKSAAQNGGKIVTAAVTALKASAGADAFDEMLKAVPSDAVAKWNIQ